MSFLVVLDTKNKSQLVKSSIGRLGVKIDFENGSWLSGCVQFNASVDEQKFCDDLSRKNVSHAELYSILEKDSFQYSVVYYRKEKDSIYILKDFSGCESAYYSIDNEHIVIASDVQMVLDNISKIKLCESSIFGFIYFEMPWKPESLFESVYCVLNGTILTFDSENNSFMESDYFSLKGIKEQESLTASDLRMKIAEAHSKRLGKENAIFLSGGVDSQVMSVALKKDIGVDDLYSYNFSIKGARDSEQEDARKTSRQLGIEFQAVEVDPNKEIDFHRFVAKQNSPYLGSLSLKAIFESIESNREITFFGGQDTRLHTPALSRMDLLYWGINKKLGRVGLSLLGLAGATGAFAIRKFKNDKVSDKTERFCKLLSSIKSPEEFLLFRHFHIHGYDFIKKDLDSNKQLIHLKSELQNIDFKEPRAAYNFIVEKNWRRQYLFDIEYMVGVTRDSNHNCVMPFYDTELAKFSSALNFRDATRMTKGRAGHSGKTVAVNKYTLREAYKGELDNDLIFRDKAVCPTSYMFFNGSLASSLDDFIYSNCLAGTEIGYKLKIDKLIDIARKKHRKWRPEDNSVLVSVFNAMVVNSLYKKIS